MIVIYEVNIEIPIIGNLFHLSIQYELLPCITFIIIIFFFYIYIIIYKIEFVNNYIYKTLTKKGILLKIYMITIDNYYLKKF